MKSSDDDDATARTPAPSAATWSPQASAGWAANVDYRERLLEGVGDALLAGARLEAGQHVLEVGSGAGALARQLSRHVGASGRVVGVDISAELNALAAARSAQGDNLRFVTADAQAVDLPRQSFDRLVSRFGIMFFADPTAALRHLHGLLRAGGGLHVAVWDSISRNPWADVVLRACRDHLALPPRRATPNGAFAFSDAAAFRSLLVDCGFRRVELQHWQDRVEVGSSLQACTDIARALLPPGVVTTLFRKLPPSSQSALLADIADRLAPYVSSAGVHMPAAAHIVRAIA